MAATKTNQTSDNEKQTASITAQGNEYVSDEATKQKLLDVVVAKMNAVAATAPKADYTALGWLAFILIILGVIVVVKKKGTENVN